MRDFYVIAVIGVLAIMVGTVLFFFGPSSLKGDVTSALRSNPTSIGFVDIASGTTAYTIATPTNYRLTSTAELQDVWTVAYGSSAHPAPTIDFTKYEVLGVFDGAHETPGYAISIESVTEQGNTRTATILHTVPGSGCIKTHKSTSPFEFVLVPKTNLQLLHINDVSTTTCALS